MTFPPYPDLPAMFGPPIPEGVERLLGVLKVADPIDACSPLKAPPAVPHDMGWVALIQRTTELSDPHDKNDSCSFVNKVIRAEEAGAVAAIVFDFKDESLRRMAPMPWDPSIQPGIPSVFVSLRTGTQLKKIIELSSNPELDPIVFFFSEKQLKWVSIFTSTTVGILAIGTVMVLFVFAKYQHGTGFGFPPGDDAEGGDVEQGGRRRRQKTTLTDEEVATLPKVLHAGSGREGAAGEEGEADDTEDLDSSRTTCAVCLDEYEDGDALLELPCGHRFHSSCIEEWLLKQSSLCPLCKTDVKKHLKKASGSGAEPGANRSEADAGASSEAEASGGADTTEETPLLSGGEHDRPPSNILVRWRSYIFTIGRHTAPPAAAASSSGSD